MMYEFPEAVVPPFDLEIIALEEQYTPIVIDGELVMHTRNVYYGDWYVPAEDPEHNVDAAG